MWYKAEVVWNDVIAQNADSYPAQGNSKETAQSLDSKDIERGSVTYQRNAYPDLRVVSWKQGRTYDDLSSYAYSTGGGSETFVYVLDSGIDVTNSVSLLEAKQLVVRRIILFTLV